MNDLIIIGAGAAGLTAARTFAKAGGAVLLLEARNRIGGRIHTLYHDAFSAPVESGAEFMHGDLPLTTALIKEAGASQYETNGQSWHVKNTHLHKDDLFPEYWNELIHTLQQLPHDMTMQEFLSQYFADPKYQSLTDAVKRLAQGYDAADITKVSAFALREEWENEDNLTGYHIEGGYSKLMEFLLQEALKHQATLKLTTIVQEIRWRQQHAEVITTKGHHYTAKKVIITVPVSVLKNGAIQFTPPLSRHGEALQQIEIGGVIKFLVEFRNPIWENNQAPGFRSMPGLHFLFSDATIPTWWTQKPSNLPLLTGWLAGPITHSMPTDDKALQQTALQSLAYIFQSTEEKLQQQIRTMKVVNWVTDPFSLGAYAYNTLNTSNALEILSEPIEKTLYFAGEALYNGKEMGTVEAAIASGHNVIKQVMQDINMENTKFNTPQTTIHTTNDTIKKPDTIIKAPHAIIHTPKS